MSLKLKNKIKYYSNGYKSCEYYKNPSKKYHNIDNPAYIEYHPDGNKNFEEWYQNGNKHRLDGPAVICYYENNIVEKEEWFRGGKLNRLNGPAIIQYYEDGEICGNTYYINGKRIKPKFYYKFLYLFKRKMRLFLNKKRENIKKNINKSIILENGNDICNLITKFI